MAVSRDVARQRFAQFVQRALADARARGMTDNDIQKATGVGQSTFHRWRRGQGDRLPTIERVQAFCAGLEMPIQPALDALGMSDVRVPTPPPALDPDVARVLRRLNDPAVPEAEKTAIRSVLRLLGGRPSGGAATQSTG
jgi:transcriptional regulator with XRE-family HTH domain